MLLSAFSIFMARQSNITSLLQIQRLSEIKTPQWLVLLGYLPIITLSALTISTAVVIGKTCHSASDFEEASIYTGGKCAPSKGLLIFYIVHAGEIARDYDIARGKLNHFQPCQLQSKVLLAYTLRGTCDDYGDTDLQVWIWCRSCCADQCQCSYCSPLLSTLTKASTFLLACTSFGSLLMLYFAKDQLSTLSWSLTLRSLILNHCTGTAMATIMWIR